MGMKNPPCERVVDSYLRGLRTLNLRRILCVRCAVFYVSAAPYSMCPLTKKLGGWASLDMVLRYAHLGADHLAEHASPIGGLRLVRTNPGTAKKTPCRKLR
jgi:hypothetical protein